MELWIKILQFFDTRAEAPASYGWFHLLWLGIMIAASVLAALCGRKMQKKTVINIVLVMAIVTIVLEIYKQINFTFGDGSEAPAYLWYAFPWQFCSTPMYVMAIVPWVKTGKLRRALCAYLATYALFAGLVVMVYPGDVFIATIGVNIQTMVHHGAMVVIGVLLFVSKTVSTHKKTIVYALPVFCVLSALALFANVVFHHTTDGAHSFNMFFISPYEVPTLVVFDKLYAYLPYPFYLLAYIFGFTLAAFLVLLVSSLIYQKNTHGEYYENNRNRNWRI